MQRLVVLPFENLGHSEDQYFADGITEEITSRLSTIGRLGVISRSSAFQFAGSDKPIRQIAKELNVHYVVTGSVQWSKNESTQDRVRIIPCLIRVRDDIQLWSQSFDRVVDDIFIIQSEIALNVVKQLGLTLGDSERNILESRPTKNLEAYHAFLRGMHFARQPHFTVESWKNVIQSYEQAVSLDPDFAQAYAELAKAHARFHFLRYDLSHERQNIAREAAEKALKLAPEDPEVHLALGYYYQWSLRDNDKALDEWTLAEKGLPNDPRILEAKAFQYELKGQWQEAINTTEKAFVLSPNDAAIPTELALMYWWNRNYPLADKNCNQAAVLAPEDPWPYLFKAFLNLSWRGKNEVSGEALLSVPPEHEWYIWTWFWVFCIAKGLSQNPGSSGKDSGNVVQEQDVCLAEIPFPGLYVHFYRGE